MFLGRRTKSKKGPSVQVDYVVHVQEITPWPPSQSLKSLRSVVLQWEYGDNVSGLTDPVIPSIEDGTIKFEKSFKLHVTLTKDGPVKGHDGGHYYKNLLELNLYEPRNKNVKGQHIGGVVVDLAEHGIIKKPVSIGVPFSCKRSFKNHTQPIVYIRIQPLDKLGSSSSSMESLPKEALSDKDGKESVSSLMTGEYTEEVDIASFTDDDESRHSSNDPEINGRTGTNDKEDGLHSKSISETSDIISSVEAPSPEVLTMYQSATLESSIDPNSTNPDTDEAPSSACSTSISPIIKTSESPTVDSPVSSLICQKSTEEIRPNTSEAAGDDVIKVEEKLVECNISTVEDSSLQHDISSGEKSSLSELKMEENNEEVQSHSTPSKCSNVAHQEEQYSPQLIPSTENYPSNDEHRESTPSNEHRVPRSSLRSPGSESPVLSRRSLGGRTNGTFVSDGKKHMKSVRIQIDDDQDIEDVKEIDVLEDTYGIGRKFSKTKSENVKHTSSNKQSDSSNYKIQELEKRVEMLERELREIAAIEISLYSVVAEHGSSAHKVHAPARRLSRLYNYALENWSLEGRASATKSIVSGLILASRACGNDVPRLTFWLSNSIVLRATVTPVIEDLIEPTISNSDGHAICAPAEIKKMPFLKWEPNDRERILSFSDESNDWQDPKIFREALEKVEAWIFSRIIESIWWQILIPRMQSGSDHEAKTILLPKRNSFMSPRLGDQQRANYSIDLWKKAFKEAYERLCPIRAEGHDCGCLPVLARLTMEQCIARLDVAMFNAVLRESEDEIPGNPVSDPISDSKVLPVPAGKLSFGAGAQLKNAIGNWSRWLTDIFGIDDELSESEKDDDDGRRNLTASLKTFSLLNALSDLLMLPKDMLLDSSTRKEICPTLSESMMKRILCSFVPDEFCPDPIPDAVFEALDSEDLNEDEDTITSFPCEAAPVAYSPPSMRTVMLAIGHIQSQSFQRSSSSVLRKCHTSDDELDELNSPLTSIVVVDKPAYTIAMQTENRSSNIIRYQLLHEVWKNEN